MNLSKMARKGWRKTKNTLAKLNDLQKWANPTAWATNKLILRYPAEAASIAVAIVAEQPHLAAPAVERIVVKELKRLLNDEEPTVSVLEPSDEPPAWKPQVQHTNFDNGHHAPVQSSMPTPVPPAAYQRPMQSPPMWFWRPIQMSPYLIIVEIVCPYFNYSPHQPVYIPLPYFVPTRGGWNQCGFCGQWSFTP
jgi:hypothetical protein